MQRWLDAVANGAREQPSLGLELARCARLVKGYGTTHARGMGHLLHILDNLAGDVLAVCSARAAALADDCGRPVPPPLAAAPAAPQVRPVHVVRRRKAEGALVSPGSPPAGEDRPR